MDLWKPAGSTEIHSSQGSNKNIECIKYQTMKSPLLPSKHEKKKRRQSNRGGVDCTAYTHTHTQGSSDTHALQYVHTHTHGGQRGITVNQKTGDTHTRPTAASGSLKSHLIIVVIVTDEWALTIGRLYIYLLKLFYRT